MENGLHQSLGSSQPRGPGETRRALGMRGPASEPRKAVQRRSDSWSTQQQLGAAESRNSKDLRPHGDCQGAVGGPLGMGSAGEGGPSGEGMAPRGSCSLRWGGRVCVCRRLCICVCVCAHLWAHVCLCVYVCACACTYPSQNVQESKVWECGCLTAHVGRAIPLLSLNFQTPKWS